MDIMKNTDSQPIELADCLTAFSKPEELGDDELWWVFNEYSQLLLLLLLLLLGIVRSVRLTGRHGRL